LTREKEAKKEHRDWKKKATERSAKLGDLKQTLQGNVNKITAIIDGDMNCLSCKAPITSTNKANAGHRWSVGANPHTRYNLHVIHRQGVCCNKWKSGNPDGYDKGLIEVYGQEYKDFVHSLHDNQFDLKLARHEVIEKNKLALAFIAHLKKLDPEYIASNRLKLRNEGNVFLGIYTTPFRG
jgi:ribosomal protein L44E